MKERSRKIAEIIEPQAVVEGAGVRLKRSIGTHTLDYLDPFLLLDHFQSKNPADYQAGFPLHPHRGIETVTYLLAGAVRHRPSVDDRRARHHARRDAAGASGRCGRISTVGEFAEAAENDRTALPER